MRRGGPVLRGICVCSGGADDYRLMSCLRVLCQPLLDHRCLFRTYGMAKCLIVRNDLPYCVKQRDHELWWRGLVTELRRQFRPMIDEPLDAVAALDEYERNVETNLDDFKSPAYLNAYFQRDKAASKYCRRAMALACDPICSYGDRNKPDREDLVRLREWLFEGNAASGTLWLTQVSVAALGLPPG